MLIGIISDPHANLHALEAVLEDARRVRPDLFVCLGDFVGYGPFPNEVTDILRELCTFSLAGNHDLCVLGSPAVPIESMNEVAAAAVNWTQDHVTSRTKDFLGSLSSKGKIDSIDVAHASPRDPALEYVLDAATAYANFEQMEFDLALVGHTHVPAIFVFEDGDVDGGRISSPDNEVVMEVPRRRAILNPGGVGQPRDGDPRASWGLLDTESRLFSVRRVEYPVVRAQEAIIAAGLPVFLAERLSVGL